VPKWAWWRKLWGRWIGHALPFAVVLTWHPTTERHMRHELRHVDQWFVLGPLFPVVCLVLLVMYGYDKHPLERDARAAE
jgi:hypothetical protein